MANKKTVALTNEHYEEIINLMLVGAFGFRPIGHQNFSIYEDSLSLKKNVKLYIKK